MFGLDAAWTVAVIATISNALVMVASEVVYEFIAAYLIDYFEGGSAAIQASCVAFGVPADLSEALEFAHTMTEENVACMREYFGQKNPGL